MASLGLSIGQVVLLADAEGHVHFQEYKAAIVAPLFAGIGFLGFRISAYAMVWSGLSNRRNFSLQLAPLLIVCLLVVFPMHAVPGSTAHIEWVVVIGSTMMTMLFSILYLMLRGVRYVFLPYS